MKLIVGLWNPWKKYEKTRHNIGFACLDLFVEAKLLGSFVYDNKIWWDVLTCRIDWEKIVFLKPMLFMNRSWGPIQQISNFYKISKEDILVIHDEIDLVVWVMKYKIGGGHAWHNWLRDIISKIWKEFTRIRVWVDRPLDKIDVADYVLSNFKKDEKEQLDEIFIDIFDKMEQFISGKL